MAIDRLRLERLQPLVGEWQTDGMLLAFEHVGSRFRANDSYDWLPGEAFLLHRWDAQMPDGRIQGVEVIGCDPGTDEFLLHSYDSAGNVAVMRGDWENGRWLCGNESMRFQGELSADGTELSGTWSVHEPANGSWILLMTTTLRRRSARHDSRRPPPPRPGPAGG